MCLAKHKNSAVEPLPEVRCGEVPEEQSDKCSVLGHNVGLITGQRGHALSPDERRI